MTALLAIILLAIGVLLYLNRGRTEPGEFDDVLVEQRKLAALARARKDHP